MATGLIGAVFILLTINPSNPVVTLLLFAVLFILLATIVMLIVSLQHNAPLLRKLTLFSNAFEHSTDGILLTDLKGRIIDVNPAFTRLFGYSRKEVVGRTTKLLRSHNSTDEFYSEMWRSIQSKGEWKGQIINRTKAGVEIPVLLSITPIFQDNQQIGYMGIEIDLREREEFERRILMAERLAAIGKMSSHVAHEVRNPLSSISLNMELIQDEIDVLCQSQDTAQTSEMNTLMGAVQKEVDRLTELVEDYLKFSRLPKHKKESVDLNELLEESIQFLARDAHQQDIDLIYTPINKKVCLFADPKQIYQVLLNIVNNAFDSMSSGGEVRISLRVEADAIVICVKDHGPGIESEEIKKIFDPFYSTKEQGTGLGLPMVQQVMHEHGGLVWCESEIGKGTTFYLQLPFQGKETFTI